MMSIYSINKDSHERLIITTAILSQKNKFTIQDLLRSISAPAEIPTNYIRVCLDDMVESGLVYQDMSKYVVKSNNDRWKIAR